MQNSCQKTICSHLYIQLGYTYTPSITVKSNGTYTHISIYYLSITIIKGTPLLMCTAVMKPAHTSIFPKYPFNYLKKLPNRGKNCFYSFFPPLLPTFSTQISLQINLDIFIFPSLHNTICTRITYSQASSIWKQIEV